MNTELPSPPAALRLSAQWETVNQLTCISKLVQSVLRHVYFHPLRNVKPLVQGNLLVQP